MYVCVFVCIYVCMYLSIHLFIYLSIDISIYLSIYLYACMYVCIYVCMYVYTGGSERRNAASAGWGSWDIWEQRRILFMKKVLAEEGVEALKSDIHRCLIQP